MKQLKVITSLIMCSIPVMSMAQKVERVYMNNGSVVAGYICEQIPGKQVTVQSEEATIVVSSDSLEGRMTERIPMARLSEQWQKWAEENRAYTESSGNKMLELTTLTFPNVVYDNVYLLEKGETLKFLDIASRKYTFPWKEMYYTVKNRRPDNQTSGIKDVVVMKDGTTYEGQILDQMITKQEMKITTDIQGVVQVKSNDVAQIKSVRLNDKEPLWNQVQLLDRISIKGERQPVEGFIISRTMGESLTLEFEDGRQRDFSFSQVVSYGKVPNEKYKVSFDSELNEGDVSVNGEKVLYYCPVMETIGQYMLLDVGIASVSSKNVGEPIIIEAKLKDLTTPITVVKSHVETLKKGRDEFQYPVFSYQDLVESRLSCERSVSMSGNTKIQFTPYEPGYYVISVQGKDGYIQIQVK